jgi:hypothetical protein
MPCRLEMKRSPCCSTAGAKTAPYRRATSPVPRTPTSELSWPSCHLIQATTQPAGDALSRLAACRKRSFSCPTTQATVCLSSTACRQPLRQRDSPFTSESGANSPRRLARPTAPASSTTAAPLLHLGRYTGSQGVHRGLLAHMSSMQISTVRTSSTQDMAETCTRRKRAEQHQTLVIKCSYNAPADKARPSPERCPWRQTPSPSRTRRW